MRALSLSLFVLATGCGPKAQLTDAGLPPVVVTITATAVDTRTVTRERGGG